MAFYSGSLSSCASLATLLTTQCVANGWALSGNWLSKGSSYIEVTSDTYNVALKGALDSTGSTSPTSQNRTICLLAGDWPVSYYLFINSSPDTVVLVVQYGTLFIQHLMFGDIVKIHPLAFTGGNFLSGSSSSSTAGSEGQNPIPGQTIPRIYGNVLRSIDDNTILTTNNDPFDIDVPQSIPFVPGFPFIGNYNTSCAIFHAEIDGDLWSYTTNITYTAVTNSTYFRCPNLTNAQTTLVPLNLQRSSSSGLYMYLGYVEHVRLVRVDNYNIGDILTLSPDQWMIFPWRCKNIAFRNGDSTSYWSTITLTQTNTGTLGFAVRYTP